MKKCPNCQFKMKDAMFCGRCGTQMSAISVMKICPSCRLKNNGATFCGQCGTPMVAAPTKLNKKIAYIIAGGTAVAIAIILSVIVFVTMPLNRYNQAVVYFNEGLYTEAFVALKELSAGYRDVNDLLPYFSSFAAFERGEYENAAQMFGSLGDFMNADEMSYVSRYLFAHELLSGGKFDDAYQIFRLLSGYMDSADMMLESRYQQAVVLIRSDSINARDMFESIRNYRNSASLVTECDFYIAMKLLDDKEFGEAYEAFIALGDYRDSREMLLEVRYRKGLDLMQEGEYDGAAERFEAIGDYKDSPAMLLESRYLLAGELIEEGNYMAAHKIYLTLGSFKDSATLAEISNADILVNTYWHHNISPGMAGHFLLRFNDDGTYSYVAFNKYTYGDGEYSYENGVLTLDGIEYRGGPDSFSSVDKHFAFGAPEDGWEFSLSLEPSGDEFYELMNDPEIIWLKNYNARNKILEPLLRVAGDILGRQFEELENDFGEAITISYETGYGRYSFRILDNVIIGHHDITDSAATVEANLREFLKLSEEDERQLAEYLHEYYADELTHHPRIGYSYGYGNLSGNVIRASTYGKLRGHDNYVKQVSINILGCSEGGAFTDETIIIINYG